MTNVLLVGAAGWGNVGDDVIAFRIIARAQREGKLVTLACGPKTMVGLSPEIRRISIGGTAMDRIKLVMAIARSSEVYIGGGGLFDDRTEGFYRPFARVAAVSRLFKTPYHIVSVGVGPLRRDDSAANYRVVFDNAASSSVRDAASLNRLRGAGVRALPVEDEDPALWEAPDPVRSVPSYDLLINLRNWELNDANGENPTPTTLDVVDIVASALESTFSGRIAVVSMSTLSADDDSEPLELLANRLSVPVDRYYSGEVEEVEALVASAGAVLTMRLHLALLATAYNTHVAAIAYDPKLTQQGKKYGFRTEFLDKGFGHASVVELLESIAAEQRGGHR